MPQQNPNKVSTPLQLVDKAFILAEDGDIPSAILQMEAACGRDSAKASMHEMLAQLLLEGNRPKDALQAAQTAVDLDGQVNCA
jgi:predicted Zn-dependent protease